MAAVAALVAAAGTTSAEPCENKFYCSRGQKPNLHSHNSIANTGTTQLHHNRANNFLCNKSYDLIILQTRKLGNKCFSVLHFVSIRTKLI